MSRNINFQHNYPYSVWSSASRFQMDWSPTQISLNGFSNMNFLETRRTTPFVVSATINVGCMPTSGTNATNRSWRLYWFNGSVWNFHAFTMPWADWNTWANFTGTWTFNSNITRIAACPASSASSHWWQSSFGIDVLRVQENLNTVTFASNEYFSGLLTDRSGVIQRPHQIHANVDGVLHRATQVHINVDGVLRALPPAYNASWVTTAPDSMRVYEFTPPTTGTYRIEVVRNSGDHEVRMFNSSFGRIHPNGTSGNTDTSYFYSGDFSLTAGTLYYISLIHYYLNTSTADSVLFISRI